MARRTIYRPKIKENLFAINIVQNKRNLRGVYQIIEYAEKIGKKVGKFLDIEELIKENEEVSLLFEDIEEDGQIAYDKIEEKYKIVINKNHSKSRQRFTMAHEYIHYQQHKYFIEEDIHKDKILYRSSLTKLDIDITANRMAAEILMPAKEFREVVKEEKGDIGKIADRFGVTVIAAIYRAELLGLK